MKPLLADESFRFSKIWTPSFSLAFRLISIARLIAALHASNVADCDEVYNYWEPLHFLVHGYGFQTWEYSPKFAIRSYFYLKQFDKIPRIVQYFLPLDKRLGFYSIRIFLGLLSTLFECRLYRSIVEHISPRVGRYFLILTLFSTAYWSAAVSLLPSTFALQLVNLAFSYAMKPVNDDTKRTRSATICFAVAAIVGWPFAVLLAFPFIFEELLIKGDSIQFNFAKRFSRLLLSGLLALALTATPSLLTDSHYYGTWTFVPWNIIKYNIFSSNANLYGTEPWYYYTLTGLLNFNIAFLLASMSLPLLVLHSLLITDAKSDWKWPMLLIMRVLPFNLWLLVISRQSHKEERFLYPMSGILLFCAALTLGLLRNFMQRLQLKWTKCPEKTAKSHAASFVFRTILVVYAAISLSRIAALYHYYNAPMNIMNVFAFHELPRLGHAIAPSRIDASSISQPISTGFVNNHGAMQDFTPLVPLNLTLCYGSEWYRFPGHFLVPHPVTAAFVSVNQSIIMPKLYRGKNTLDATRSLTTAFNDQNQEMADQYTDVSHCSYLMTLDFPLRLGDDSLDCIACDTETWQTVSCLPYLDNAHSNPLTRSLFVPGDFWQLRNSYGRFCLLKSTSLL